MTYTCLQTPKRMINPAHLGLMVAIAASFGTTYAILSAVWYISGHQLLRCCLCRTSRTAPP